MRATITATVVGLGALALAGCGSASATSHSQPAASSGISRTGFAQLVAKAQGAGECVGVRIDQDTAGDLLALCSNIKITGYNTAADQASTEQLGGYTGFGWWVKGAGWDVLPLGAMPKTQVDNLAAELGGQTVGH